MKIKQGEKNSFDTQKSIIFQSNASITRTKLSNFKMRYKIKIIA